MPDRYWVGGTASWDGTADTKWATTSGGPGGASVPTTADDVFFDAASGAGTVTIASGNTGAKSINCTGFTGTITGSIGITVAGSVTLVETMTYTHTSTVTFTDTGTLTTAGKIFSTVNINGSGITLTLGDALNLSTGRPINLTAGTFTTAGFTVTASALNATSTINDSEINLGASTLNIGGPGIGISFATTAALTFNAGTSQINISGTGMNGGNKTFYNVSFTGTSSDTTLITGVNTFNNLAFTGPVAAGLRQVQLNAIQTVNGELSTTGTAGNRRVWFRSAVYGIASPLLTINGTVSLTDADFRDVIVTGTAAPISGTRIGDLRGCSGIVFSTPKRVFRIGTGSWADNQWADISGGSVSTDNFPLAQDTAVFDQSTSGGTHSMSSLLNYCGTIDMSARTSALTLTLATFTVYGDWITGSGITFGSFATITFSGRNTQTITSAGKVISMALTVDSFGGYVELADAFNNGFTISLINGTFDTGGFTVTTGQLNSNLTDNVKAILLRNSTVNISNATPLSGIIPGNLTFDAGISTIQCTATSSMTFNGFGLTYYNVSFTNTSGGQPTITGTNMFNNLSVTAPASTTIQSVIFSADQTINGTFTVNGGSPIRRLFVRSNTIGTTRTLSVNSLSATDCDFRDIAIVGAAAGSSPTRAGDCGGNSGITFPAPKTVYWNLAGTQNWSATGWATSSGGSPNINNFPLAQDTAVFDNTGAAGTVTFTPDWAIGTFDLSARTTAMTFNISAGPNIYGNIIIGSGVTLSGTGNIRFNGRGTSTITSAGKQFTGSMTVESPSGTVQLADALSLAFALTVGLGTFDAVSYNVTAASVSVSATTTRTVKMGSGTWTITGTSTVWNATTITNLTFDPGTAEIVLSDTSTTARTFTGGGLYYHKLTIGGTTGISTLTITGNNTFGELASTKTVAHTIALGTSTQRFGKWTVTGTAGNVVTLTGTGTSHVMVGACTSGIDYLAMGSIGFAATSPGEFYAGANSTGTAAAPVYRTAKPADSTRYWVGGTGNWSDTARWSTGSGGAGGASVPRSHDDVVFDSASNATAYTATVNVVTGGARCKSLTIAGPTSGNVTLAGSVALFIHNDVTLPATGLTRTYTGPITLSGSTTGRTFTTNGVTLASSIIIDGVGCEWLLGTALNIGTANFTVTSGAFAASGYALTANALLSNNLNVRSIDLGASVITLSASNQTINFTVGPIVFNAGTSQLNLASNYSISGTGQTLYNVTFTTTTQNTFNSISGVNTFNNLTVNTSNGSPIRGLNIENDQIINDTFTCAGANARSRMFIRSNVIGVSRTLTAATLAGNDCDFRDITIAGVAANTAPTRAGDCGGNSGISFPAAKTVYRVGTSGFWDSVNSWALTSGGTGATDNQPLAQDTAIINNATTGTSLDFVNHNIGTIDASARTNAFTLSNTTGFSLYGSYTLGSGITISGTSDINVNGRSTMDFTSAGKTITSPIVLNAPSGTLRLLDSLTMDSARTFTHTAGTLDLNGFTLTVGASYTTGIGTKVLQFNGGTLVCTGAFNNAQSAGFSVIANNVTISMSSESPKTFTGGNIDYSGITISQTGAGTLTIGGNNTFKDIITPVTSTSATTISLGTTTQRLAQFTGKGESGRQLTITGTSLIYTGTGYATNSSVDFLTIIGVRAYALQNTWFAGNNSINNGTLGWTFAGTPAVVQNGNFLMLT